MDVTCGGWFAAFAEKMRKTTGGLWLDGRIGEIRGELTIWPECAQLFEALGLDYLILPMYRNTTSWKFGVKRVITGIDVDTFDGRELLDVEDIFGVDSVRLHVMKAIWVEEITQVVCLTSGTNGGSSKPASNLFQLISWKNSWAFTSLAPYWLSEQPSRSLTLFFSNWNLF